MRISVGIVILVIGLLHIVYVMVTMRKPLRAIANAGVLNGIGSNIDREAAFWSWWFGGLLATIGYLLHWITSHGKRPPALPGWVLICLGVSGGILSPVGPFWLLIPIGALLLAQNRHPSDFGLSSQCSTAFTASPQFARTLADGTRQEGRSRHGAGE